MLPSPWRCYTTLNRRRSTLGWEAAQAAAVSQTGERERLTCELVATSKDVDSGDFC